MAVLVFNNVIRMTRGNTVRIPLVIFHRDSPSSEPVEYTPTAEDTIRFAMKVSYLDDALVLSKTIPHNDLFLTLNPEDTASLPQPSKYVYDITITFPDGTIDTIVPNGRLEILEKV